MAVIRIFESGGLPPGSTIRHAPARLKQSVTIAGTSDQSTAFALGTRHVAIQADAACHVVFGRDPTATTDDFKIQAGATEDFWVNPGLKVAVIEA
jgi:hypothetical protein